MFSLLNLFINNYKLDLLLNLSCQLTEGNSYSIQIISRNRSI
jgi:hypothetical protein